MSKWKGPPTANQKQLAAQGAALILGLTVGSGVILVAAKDYDRMCCIVASAVFVLLLIPITNMGFKRE